MAIHALGEPSTQVWARLHALARREGEPVSVRHACVVCAELTEATGACLSMVRDGGAHEPVFATDEHSRRLDELQSTVGEGPGLDAFAWGAPVLTADLRAPEACARWPVFTSEAARLGVRSVIAMPVRAGAAKLGVLACYRDRPGLPGRGELSGALVCADTVLVLALDGSGNINPSLARLFDIGFAVHGAHVHQAAGMVSVQLGLSITDALARLRAHAFARDRPLGAVAADVVGRRLRFGGDGQDRAARRFAVAEDGDAPGDGNEEGKDR
ncbi:hypothetical protein FHS29_002484 [Saccharothrix tamanrassetensis]|uniref:ANTAR domain-containing protein n=1 Tax=Saccharothrix tamanrassetensis TaxID=1051531 RepID=A0A841CFZ1_9PSEU|nr:GAF and ANTAR domain-containing protein [Saccharothrix tamanrassetensis]MBB5955903.1 hypothetical protein [Saccharothrix tamanrassetensis]